jgi:hypothetical protein
MKKILFTILQLSFVAIAIAQTTIVSENFDNLSTPSLPPNWQGNSVNSLTWRTDSSNFSTAYTNASGLKNLMIRNSDSTGLHTLISSSFSTVGYSSVSLIWASRVSTNFLTPGSTTPHLFYSINNGQTWDSIAYIDNQPNATWALVNNGVAIDLPAGAINQSSVMIKWEINIVYNTNGTYRIDDLLINGTPGSLNTQTISLENCENPFSQSLSNNGSIKLFNNSACQNSILNVYAQNGTMMKQIKLANNIGSEIDLSELAKGIYILELINSSKKTKQKIILN